MANCTHCGAALVENMRFCTSCGQSIASVSAAPVAGVAETSLRQQVTPGETSLRPPQAAETSFRPQVPAAEPVYQTQPPAYQQTQPTATTYPTEPLGGPMAPKGFMAQLADHKVFIAGVVLASVLGGVLFGFFNKSGEAGELVANVPVGPAGANILLGERARLEIPPGALDKTTRITVRKMPNNRRLRFNPPGGGLPQLFPPGAIIVFIFGPIDLVFLRPVTIFLPIPQIGVPGIVFVQTQNGLGLAQGQVDYQNGQIMIQTQDFRFGGVQQSQVISR